jgi:hypothetical protein
MRASVRPLVTICAVVMFLLLPVQFVYLPLRMSAADVWAVATMPLLWVALARLRQTVRLPYLAAMLFVLAATLLASLLSADPVGGLAVALKETYLYAWMVTMAAVFALGGPQTPRRLLQAWYAGVAVNGALILAQFVHPPLQQQMNAAVGALGGTLDPYRPSGLMANTNAAAVFQLMGFVPLVALRLPPRTLVSLGLFTLASIVATGSMGAMLAWAAGLACALALLAVYARDLSSASSSCCARRSSRPSSRRPSWSSRATSPRSRRACSRCSSTAASAPRTRASGSGTAACGSCRRRCPSAASGPAASASSRATRCTTTCSPSRSSAACSGCSGCA